MTDAVVMWLDPEPLADVEAARSVLDEALANGHPRVRANMWPHNEASAAICHPPA